MRFKERTRATSQAPEIPREVKNGFRFPLIRGLSQALGKCLQNTDARLIPYNLRRVGDVHTRLKDPTPTMKRSEVIYRIPCECGKCYVGQTSQLLGTRMRQHKYDCKPENHLKDKEKTALADHHFTTGHEFLFNAVEVVDVETNWRKRNISEMVHISLNDTVNKREDTMGLSCMYANLLGKFKKRIQQKTSKR